MRRTAPILQRIDWITIGLVLAFMAMGLLNIASSTSGAEAVEWFDLNSKVGKQFIWVLIALGIAAVTLIVEGEFFIRTTVIHYVVNIVLLIAVLLIGKTVGGAKSWFGIGSVSLQPSEFAKTGTALMLAWLLSRSDGKIRNTKTLVQSVLIVCIPAALIMLQPDAGTVLVYGGLIFAFYREGLSGNVLIAVFCALILLIATILMGVSSYDYPGLGIQSSIGWLWLVLVGLGALIWRLIPGLVIPRNRKRIRKATLICFTLSLAFSAGVHSSLEGILKTHQKERIYVLFGIDVGNPDADYNIRHAKAAVSSGGWTGKGFLQGPMTAYGFVPEQETDFIFCTIGEEWGFLGSTVAVLLYTMLLLRILILAERQRSDFTRIYAYAVASILFMHFLINVGMVLGLAPVIGIPLPFLSAGGSSLVGFTTLIAILLRLDAERSYVLR
jgi:rod shape determining protein RodA